MSFTALFVTTFQYFADTDDANDRILGDEYAVFEVKT
jgi:hypothetical protein